MPSFPRSRQRCGEDRAPIEEDCRGAAEGAFALLLWPSIELNRGIQEAIASGDTPLNASFQARQERTGSATMILSVGNRGSAPMLEGDVGPNLRANPGPSKKTEKAARAQKSAEEGYNLTPMLSAPIASTSAESPAPVPRQAVGFQRVKAVSPAVREESPAQPSTPTASTSTIRIALGGKRKAEDEGDSPASKRKA